MTSIKQKPNKLKYLSVTNTLDEMHQKYVTDFESKKNLLPNKKEKLLNLEKQLLNLESSLENNKNFSQEVIHKRVSLRDNIKKLKEEIYDIENNTFELDYYIKTNDTLTEYYSQLACDYDIEHTELEQEQELDLSKLNNLNNLQDLDDDKDYLDNQENKSSGSEKEINTMSVTASNLVSDKLIKLNLLSQKNRKVKKPTKKRIRNVEIKNNNIMKFFIEEEKDTSSNSDNTDNKENNKKQKTETNRAILFDEYLNILDKATSYKNKSPFFKICQTCEMEKTLVHSEGMFACKNCGEVEYIIIESEIPNHKDNSNEKPRYPYKRLNHLIEWLNQFQAKESTEIPEYIYTNILEELNKQRENITILTYDYPKQKKTVKRILKKLKYNQYYEHIPFIISKITGKAPPTLSREVEEKIKTMFKQIQEPFAKYCPKKRINFLNYSFILHKFFQLLEMPEFARCFTLLKSREKLKEQEKIWKNICQDLNWNFYSSL
jgi:predicted RNA-binding Zn-ribbon protein involved in translation (DUF1610 family)